MRPPAQEFQPVVRLGEHPAVGYGEVTYTAGFHYAMDFGKVTELCGGIAHVFDDVVGQNDIEACLFKRQFHALYLLVRVTIVHETIVVDIDCGDGAIQVWSVPK